MNFTSNEEGFWETNVVSVRTMGLRILAMRQRMHGAAGSNEEPLKGIDPRLCKKQKKKKRLTWLSVTSHDPRIDQFEAIRIFPPHPCGFPSTYLIFYAHGGAGLPRKA